MPLSTLFPAFMILWEPDDKKYKKQVEMGNDVCYNVSMVCFFQ